MGPACSSGWRLGAFWGRHQMAQPDSGWWGAADVNTPSDGGPERSRKKTPPKAFVQIFQKEMRLIRTHSVGKEYLWTFVCV